MKKPKISIVLGSYNRKKFLKEAIKSIRGNNISVPYEIIVIDGGSTDGSIEYLTKQKDIITIIQHNRGVWNGNNIERKSWGYFMNIAFKSSHGKYIVMISDDCLLIPNSIMNGYFLFESNLDKNRKIGAVAFYFRDYPIQENYAVLYTFKHKLFVNHGMYSKDALESVGYIDEDNYEFYYADGDLCAKMWQNGFEVIDSPNSIVEHFFHANETIRESNYLNKSKNFQAFKDKWAGIFYSKDKYNTRGKKYLDYQDNTDTAKFFRQIYNKKQNLFSKLINTYINRRPKKIIGNPSSAKIIIKHEEFILIENKNKFLPEIKINHKESMKTEIEDFVQKTIGLDFESKIVLVGQSGIRPEKEIYFFVLKINNTEFKKIDERNYSWENIKNINTNDMDENHIPFLSMCFDLK